MSKEIAMGDRKSEYSIPNDFASAASLVRSLIAKRKLVKVALENRTIAVAFDLIGDTARDGEGTERLQAVSLLGKAAEISKPAKVIALPLLKGALRLPLPPTASWGTADDRYYLAKGVSACFELWIPAYAAVELARGEAAERKSRKVWAEIAINRAKSLASTLETVANALSQDRQRLNFTIDTSCRKLNRIAVAIRELLPLADVPTGEGFGKAFSGLVTEAGDRKGPDIRSLRQETAVNILDLMIQMLRLRFDATLDSDVYNAAGTILSWWKPAQPPETLSLRTERIARIAMDALHTLSRQGVRQRILRQALVSSFGAELINRIGTEIVSKDPSLDGPTATWLSQGRTIEETRSNLAVREVTEQDLDELVAKLMLSIGNEEGGPQSLELMADDIAALEPRHTATVRAAIARARLSAQWVQAIASNRKLALSGQRGDLVQYDPVIHDAAHDLQLRARARISVPGVVKQLRGQPPKVILKIQVEKP